LAGFDGDCVWPGGGRRGIMVVLAWGGYVVYLGGTRWFLPDDWAGDGGEQAYADRV